MCVIVLFLFISFGFIGIKCVANLFFFFLFQPQRRFYAQLGQLHLHHELLTTTKQFNYFDGYVSQLEVRLSLRRSPLKAILRPIFKKRQALCKVEHILLTALSS